MINFLNIGNNEIISVNKDLENVAKSYTETFINIKTNYL